MYEAKQRVREETLLALLFLNMNANILQWIIFFINGFDEQLPGELGARLIFACYIILTFFQVYVFDIIKKKIF